MPPSRSTSPIDRAIGEPLRPASAPFRWVRASVMAVALVFLFPSPAHATLVALTALSPSLAHVSWILAGTLALVALFTVVQLRRRSRRSMHGLRRRWRSRTPSGARRGVPSVAKNDSSANGPATARATDAAFRLAARAWRERLAITAPSPAAGCDARFNAVLRIHSALGDRAQAPLERLLRECTRRWELRACEPGENGITVLRYGVRVPRASRGLLLDALRHSALVEGVELR